MDTIALAADMLQRNLGFMTNTLADFSDADMLVRPCSGANHAMWQIGHLIVAETMMMSGVKAGSMPELPAGFLDKFKKENASKDDAAFFPKKQQILDQFNKTRAGTIALVKTLKPADLDTDAPEQIRGFAPTVGHLAFTIPVHVAMHVGQFQAIRRNLGKPVLF